LSVADSYRLAKTFIGCMPLVSPRALRNSSSLLWRC
jgi:hypothetical protein